MKRKIFSKLLMVALVIAAVGSFVSCKDYDDDINNLQKQIDAKAALSELTALQSTLDSKIAAAQSAAQAAQATADAAATKTAVADLKTALEAAIADAKKAGTDAGTQAGNAITAANKAQETADGAAAAAKKADEDAKAALADALKTISETYATKAEAAAASTAAADAATAAAEAKAAIEKLGDTYYTIAEAEKLQKQVDDLKADLESSIEEKVKEAIKDVENAKASVDAIWSAVTSIEFLVSDLGDIDNSTILNFQFGKQVDNVFGDGKELHAYESTDKPATYKAGDDIKAENIFYVRVSPVTADLTASTLKMVNSLGEDLSDYVDIKAEAYNELITRAGATGIWKLTATLKEGIDRANLEKAAHAVFSLNKKVQKSVAVYAIAACNTEDEADRFAVTSYDLYPKLNEYTPAYELNFYVNKNEVADIRNRWYEDGDDFYILSESNDEERDTTNWELAWNAAQAKAGEFDVPAVKAQKNIGKSNKYNNYIKDVNDARRDADLKFLQVQVDEPIKVTFDSEDYPYVDKYYVLLEKDNAIESKPSEYESWQSYNIEGLGIMKKASESLTLTIPAAAAEGDIVGFRLYAVNFDGTLVDPDGKAFYVQVGNINSKAEPQVITGTFNPKKVGVAAANATEAVKDTINAVVIPFDAASMFKIANKTTNFANFGLKANVAIKRGTEDNTMTLAENTTAKIFYLKSNELITKDGKQVAQTATTFDEIKYIAISVTNPESIIDGEAVQTEPLTIIDYDKQAKPVLGNIAFLLTKGEVKGVISEPTEASKFSWKSGQNGTFYLAQNGTPGVAAGTFQWGVADKYFSEETGAFMEFNLYDYSNGLDNYTDAAYTWTVKHGDVETVIADHTAAIVTAQYSWLVDKDETNTATFTITKGAATGVKTISRVLDVVGKWNDAAEDSYLVELKNSAIVNQTLTFADPMLYQTWTMELPKYKVGQAAATADADDKLVESGTQALGLSYSNVVAAAGKNVLALLWKDATLDGATPKRIATEAVKFDADGIAATAAAKYGTLEKIFPKASNSVLKTANWAWDFTTASATNNYNARLKGLLPISAADAAKGVKNVYVEKLGGGGTKDEYVKATVTFDKTTPANGVKIEFAKSTASPVTYNTELQLQLVIKVEDRFAQTKTFTIPFTLIP